MMMGRPATKGIIAATALIAPSRVECEQREGEQGEPAGELAAHAAAEIGDAAMRGAFQQGLGMARVGEVCLPPDTDLGLAERDVMQGLGFRDAVFLGVFYPLRGLVGLAGDLHPHQGDRGDEDQGHRQGEGGGQ
jgi:hypothetical protein